MIIVLLSGVFSWCFLRLLIPQLRLQLPDQPNARSSHRQPTPRGGGLAFVLSSCACSGIALLIGTGSVASAVPLFAAPLAFVGLLDDRHNLPSLWRYSAQLMTAALMLCISPLVQGFFSAIASGSWFLLALVFFLLISVTAVINFTNFMDGLDGLVAGCIAVSFTAASIRLSSPWTIWCLVGALLGFLIWNWSPAKVFMGDVGSTFLGAVFGGLVLQASSWSQSLALLLVCTPLLSDACLCVLRRLLAGHRVFQAHKLHLFQRLHQAGWPHSRVSFLYIVATSVLAIALVWGGLTWVISIVVLELLIGIWLDQRVAVPFSVASLN